MRDLIKTKANGRSAANMTSHIIATKKLQLNSVKATTITVENNHIIIDIVDDSFSAITGLLDGKTVSIKNDYTPKEASNDGKTVSIKNDYTPKEACKVLNVTKMTMYRWQKKGFLIPFHVGRKLYYKKAEILNLINKGGEL